MSVKQVIMATLAIILALVLMNRAGADILSSEAQGALYPIALFAVLAAAVGAVASRFVGGGVWEIILQRLLWGVAILILAFVAWMVVTDLLGRQLGYLATFLVLIVMLGALVVDPRPVASIAFPLLLVLGGMWLVPKIDFGGLLQDAQQKAEEVIETPVSTEEATATPVSEEPTEAPASAQEITVIQWTTVTAEDGRPLVGVSGHFFFEGRNELIIASSLDEGRFKYDRTSVTSWEDGQSGIAVLQAGGRNPVFVAFHFDASAEQLVPSSREDTIAMSLQGEGLDLSEASALISDCTSQECAEMVGKAYSLIQQGDPLASVEDCVADQPVKGEWLLTSDANGSVGTMPFESSGQTGWKCTVGWLGQIYVLSDGQIVTNQPLEGD